MVFYQYDKTRRGYHTLQSRKSNSTLGLKWFFYLVFILLLLSVYPQIGYGQSKAIAVVVDNSGSMFGRQMENSVFALQMINSLKDKRDVLGVFANGKELLAKGSTITEQNHSFLAISQTEGKSLCKEVTSTFSWLNQYAIEGYRTELVILSDGELRLEPKRGVPFTCDNSFKNEFSNFFERTGTTVHFAKIISGGHNNNCSLCDVFESFPIVRQYTIDVEKNRRSLFQFLNRLAFNLSGASYNSRIPVDVEGNRIRFHPKFPLSKFTVLFLNRESGKKLPSIEHAKIEDSKKTLSLIDKSEASLESFEQPHWSSKNSHIPLRDEAVIWHFESPDGQVINSNSKVDLIFNKEIDSDKVWIIPKTGLTATAFPGETAVLIDSAKRNYQICDDQKHIQIYAQLFHEKGKPFENDNLINCHVRLKSGNEEFVMNYEGGGKFAVNVPIEEKEKQWFDVSLEYDAYFYFEPEVFSIEKVNCGEVFKLTRSQTGFKDSVAIGPLIKNDTICSNLFQLVEPGDSRPTSVLDYNVEVLEKPPYTEVTVMPIDSKTWEVCYFLDSNACECWYKAGEYPLNILFKSKRLGQPNYSLKENIRFSHNDPWHIRCFREIIAICFFLVAIVYLALLIKKKRFPARLRITRKSHNGARKSRNLKAGFFNRYLNPFGAEKCHHFGFRFIAAGRKKAIVYLDKKSIKGTMTISGQLFLEQPNRNVLVYIQEGAIQYIDTRGGKVTFDLEKF